MNPSATGRPEARLPAMSPRIWVAQGVWFENVFQGISRFAHKNGWTLDASLRFSRGPVSKPSIRPDAIIAFTLGTPGLEEAVKSLQAEGVPLIDMEAYVDRYGAPRVLGDDALVGRLAAEHLASLHPKSLHASLPFPGGSVAQARRESFLRAAREAGVPAEIHEPGAIDVLALAKEGPVGFYAASETIASELLATCLRAGVRVPEDVAILSGDDFGTVCENAPVPISSVDLAMEEKGRVAAELLARLLRGEKVPAVTVVPPAGVISRESTRLFRSGDDDVDRLVNHLRENCHRRVGLDKLCEEIGMPVRTAQHRLKMKMGTTPGKLLREFRLAGAERLECAIDLKKDDIARAVGYSGRSGLSRARKAGKK